MSKEDRQKVLDKRLAFKNLPPGTVSLERREELAQELGFYVDEAAYKNYDVEPEKKSLN